MYAWNHSHVFKPHSRFSKHIEHGDAFWWLRRVKVIQSGYRVDDAKHHSCFHPVIHQVKVSQPHWKQCNDISSAASFLSSQIIEIKTGNLFNVSQSF